MVAAGRLISWGVLAGVPTFCAVVAAAALLGQIELDPMWTILALILAVVFYHGAHCVLTEEMTF